MTKPRWSLYVNDRLHCTGCTLADADAISTALCAAYGVRCTLVVSAR